MRLRCENCNRPLLNSDTTCFHCGTPVPGRQAPAEAEFKSDLRGATRYGALLVALMVIGLFSLHWLGSGFSDAVDPSPTLTPPTGWRSMSPADESFTIWLPVDWQVYTPAFERWQDLFAQLAHPLPAPFGRRPPTAAGERVSLIAQSAIDDLERSLVVSVDCHPALADYNLALLQHDDWSVNGTLIDAREGTNVMLRPSGRPALIAELVYPLVDSEGPLLHTITLIVQSKRGMYAITASAASNDFVDQEEILWAILESFQPRN